MSWNHRVVEVHHVGLLHNAEKGYEIREAFYDPKGRIYATTTQPSQPYGETPDELREDIQRMLLACDKPVLLPDNIPEPGAVPPPHFIHEEE